MMRFFKKLNNLLDSVGEKTKDLSLLFLRLILAYGFYSPAVSKWNDINAVGNWFESMGYPFPHLNAYMAGITEALGVILLILGIGVRGISAILIFVMFVAITTVHLKHGFNAGDNGFEIPLYYAIMLFALFSYGGGKYGLSSLLK
jgi:putative oxidoreductase